MQARRTSDNVHQGSWRHFEVLLLRWDFDYARRGNRMVLDIAARYFAEHVLPAAMDYDRAEQELSAAFDANDPSRYAREASEARRRAAQLAVALDGLPDRCADELGLRKPAIRQAVQQLCQWPGSTYERSGVIERVRGLAVACRHHRCDDPSLPIWSNDDVLTVALGYGLDAYGVGKPGGVEVLLRERDGTLFKFLADAPAAISAWSKYLSANGAALSTGPIMCGGVQAHP